MAKKCLKNAILKISDLQTFFKKNAKKFVYVEKKL